MEDVKFPLTEEKIKKISGMILTTAKSGDKKKADVYRLIKSKYLNYKTAPKAVDMTDAEEINLLNKMLKERQDSAKQYMDVALGTKDPEQAKKATANADQELYEAGVISELLPKQATEAEIKAQIEAYIEDMVSKSPDGSNTLQKKDMGPCIKYVKGKLANVDGRMLSQLVNAYIA